MKTLELPITGFKPYKDEDGNTLYRVFCKNGKETINVKSAEKPSGGYALIDSYAKGEQPDWATEKFDREVNVLQMMTDSRIIRESTATKQALAELAELI